MDFKSFVASVISFALQRGNSLKKEEELVAELRDFLINRKTVFSCGIKMFVSSLQTHDEFLFNHLPGLILLAKALRPELEKFIDLDEVLAALDAKILEKKQEDLAIARAEKRIAKVH